MSDYRQHFTQVAGKYDSLRQEATDEVVDWLIEAGDLRSSRRLIDIGCGTAATTKALAERLGIEAVGIDPSGAMLEQGRSASVQLIEGRAEELPFEDGSFDRALMQTAIHLFDRPVALSEARRVLADHSGALLVATVDPAGIDAFWLAEWFPSLAEIDRRRFAPVDVLDQELRGAGFAQVGISRHARQLNFTRDHALAMLRARFASSFALIDEDEYAEGLARAERAMDEEFTSTLRLVCLTASTS